MTGTKTTTKKSKGGMLQPAQKHRFAIFFDGKNCDGTTLQVVKATVSYATKEITVILRQPLDVDATKELFELIFTKEIAIIIYKQTFEIDTAISVSYDVQCKRHDFDFDFRCHGRSGLR